MSAPVLHPAEPVHPYVRDLARSIRSKFGANADAVAQAYDDYLDYRKPDGHMNHAERTKHAAQAKATFNARVWEIMA